MGFNQTIVINNYIHILYAEFEIYVCGVSLNQDSFFYTIGFYNTTARGFMGNLFLMAANIYIYINNFGQN